MFHKYIGEDTKHKRFYKTRFKNNLVHETQTQQVLLSAYVRFSLSTFFFFITFNFKAHLQQTFDVREHCPHSPSWQRFSQVCTASMQNLKSIPNVSFSVLKYSNCDFYYYSTVTTKSIQTFLKKTNPKTNALLSEPILKCSFLIMYTDS